MATSFFKDKEKKKRLERWLGRQWVKLIILISRSLTFERARRFGRILGRLGFYLIPRHRRAAIRNISLIYGKEKPKEELRRMIQRTFIRASCFGWEVLYLHAHDLIGKEVEDLVKEVEGLEHLKKALSFGKGVIALTAHLGNFLVLGRKLASLGIPNTAIMRQMKDGKLEDMLINMRSSFGQRCIPKLPVSRAIKESIAWLREGKVLVIFMDQRSGKGVTVDFMGIPTPTPTGPAVFALKTGAKVLPIVNVENTNGFCKLIIGKEIPVIKTGDPKRDILENTARFNKVIEKYIRLYPDQWFWFHNRWKGVKVNEQPKN